MTPAISFLPHGRIARQPPMSSLLARFIPASRCSLLTIVGNRFNRWLTIVRDDSRSQNERKPIAGLASGPANPFRKS